MSELGQISTHNNTDKCKSPFTFQFTITLLNFCYNTQLGYVYLSEASLRRAMNNLITLLYYGKLQIEHE